MRDHKTVANRVCTLSDYRTNALWQNVYYRAVLITDKEHERYQVSTSYKDRNDVDVTLFGTYLIHQQL